MTKLTRGQQLVGLGFNPSGKDIVTQFKQKIAEAIDIIAKSAIEDTSNTKELFADSAIDKLITAQMWGVKTLTWKD